MTDIATISLRVNTSELERGNQALDLFQQSADKAADGVNTASNKILTHSDLLYSTTLGLIIRFSATIMKKFNNR